MSAPGHSFECVCRSCQTGGFQHPDDLDRFLAENPCKCGGHYNAHDMLSQQEVEDALGQDCAVRICETHLSRVRDGGVSYFCVVLPPPENPCDEDFMKDIST